MMEPWFVFGLITLHQSPDRPSSSAGFGIPSYLRAYEWAEHGFDYQQDKDLMVINPQAWKHSVGNVDRPPQDMKPMIKGLYDLESTITRNETAEHWVGHILFGNHLPAVCGATTLRRAACPTFKLWKTECDEELLSSNINPICSHQWFLQDTSKSSYQTTELGQGIEANARGRLSVSGHTQFYYVLLECSRCKKMQMQVQ